MMSQLAACLLNISEGRQHHIIEKVAKAAGIGNKSPYVGEFKCQSTVLNIFSDNDYNRSVLTIVATLDQIQNSVINACKEAYNHINLKLHEGEHPRLGSVDLIPIYPLIPSVSLSRCGEIAQKIGNRLVDEVPGTSIFWFGYADRPNLRGLVECRKEVSWYKGKQGLKWDNLKYDHGQPPTSRYGLTGIGASPYVMNCNVTMETKNLAIGHEIAQAIRGTSSGGLKGVQTMAFRHEGAIEIACNVEAFGWSEVRRFKNQQKKYLFHAHVLYNLGDE